MIMQPLSVCILCHHPDCEFDCVKDIMNRRRRGGGGSNAWMDIAWREFVLFTHVWRHFQNLHPLDLNGGPDVWNLNEVTPTIWNTDWSAEVLFGPVGMLMAHQQEEGQEVEIPPGYVHSVCSDGLIPYQNRRRMWYTMHPEMHENNLIHPHYERRCECDHDRNDEHSFRLSYLREPQRRRGLFSSGEDSDDETIDGRAPVIVDHPLPRIPSPVRRDVSPTQSACSDVRVKLEDISVGSPMKRHRSDSSSSSS